MSSKWRPPAEWRTCADCAARFRVARNDSPATRCVKHRYRDPGGWLHRPKKYPNTEFSDGLIRSRYDGKKYGRADEIAKALGWPTWVVKKRAQVLGLTYTQDRHDWTEEEIKFLTEWTGVRYVHWIAKKLGRSLTSVVLKQKRLKISRRVKEGYDLQILMACFGLDHHGIRAWVEKGLLRMERGIPCGGGAGRRWKVSEVAVFEFIWNNPTAFRLDKVDQVWFMGLMKRSMETALAAAKHKSDLSDELARVRPGGSA